MATTARAHTPAGRATCCTCASSASEETEPPLAPACPLRMELGVRPFRPFTRRDVLGGDAPGGATGLGTHCWPSDRGLDHPWRSQESRKEPNPPRPWHPQLHWGHRPLVSRVRRTQSSRLTCVQSCAWEGHARPWGQEPSGRGRASSAGAWAWGWWKGDRSPSRGRWLSSAPWARGLGPPGPVLTSASSCVQVPRLRHVRALFTMCLVFQHPFRVRGDVTVVDISHKRCVVQGCTAVQTTQGGLRV